MYDDNAYPQLPGFVVRHKRAKPITIPYNAAPKTQPKPAGAGSPVQEGGSSSTLGNSGDFCCAHYSDLEITPQAIRGGAPLSVELLTA